MPNSVARYHARCWAEGKSLDELEAEIARTELKARTHHYQWNEVGCASWDFARADELRAYVRTVQQTVLTTLVG